MPTPLALNLTTRATGAIGVLVLACPAVAQGDEPSERMSLLDVVMASGVVGIVLLVLSVAAVALVVDAFLLVRKDKTIPEGFTQEVQRLAKQGRTRELASLANTNDTMLGRIIGAGLAQGDLGLPAVREAMRQAGALELTRMRQRIGYLGFVGAVAPMLGLLGTVLGMISSFQVLGADRSAADPGELAQGIAEALITTTLGLIIAIPVLFFHGFLRNRLTLIGHEASTICERMIHSLAATLNRPQQPRPATPEPTA